MNLTSKNTNKIKPIPGFPNYAITKDGRVWSYPKEKRHRGKWLKFSLSNKGYHRVWLKGSPKRHLVHRLVGLTFIKNPEKLPQINHKNGVKTDNRTSNLEWCTASQNHKHAYKIGIHKPRI